MYREIIAASIKRISGQEASLEVPENADFGDFSTNLAMQMKGNPRENAPKLVDLFKKDPELSNLAHKIEVAGPGFINFYLAKEVLLTNLEKIGQEKAKYGASDIGQGKTVVVEYSSPNIAKHFGIGHLRSTIIGQSLFNLYEFLGYKVIGENHLGDWGTQFGTLLYQINKKQLTINNLTIDELQDLYVEFNKQAEAAPEFWDKARAWFKKLEVGDADARQIWQVIVEKSRQEFDRIYQILGVKIEDSHGESFYEDKMPQVIQEIRTAGLSKKSEGAEIVEFKDMPPAMLIKSDGTTTYFTRDLAALAYRIKTWDPKLIIYEVGSDQILHFRQVFETAKLLGWAKNREFVHIAHGLIRFEHGKMSTRKGQSVKLEEVLNEAIKRAKALAKDGGEEIARAVGIGAIKYFDLAHHPQSEIVFDWDKIFVLEGNSAPYLQYTIARTNSVLAKARSAKYEAKNGSGFNPEEALVLRGLVRFPEIVVASAWNYSPNLLCNYLFDLAQKFNVFYDHNRIIGSDNLEFRLQLTSAVGQVLQNGLKLLGIEAPEKM